MRHLVMAATVVGLTCGGGNRAGTEAASATALPGDAMTVVHEVQMLVTPDGDYVYRPDTVRIRVGDRVRWVNVSGGPHNVAFYPEGIPPGAAPVLNAAMPDRLADLTGGLVFDDNAVYEVAFAGVPEGTYPYFCTPHELVGMKAWLVVTR